MDRIDYDPEIDPSIRLEREAAARERELSSRIRLEIERYVEEHDLVPRAEAASPFTVSDLSQPPWDEEPDDPYAPHAPAPHAPAASRTDGSPRTKGAGRVERVELNLDPGKESPPLSEKEMRREQKREERQAREDEREAARELKRERRARSAEGRRRAVQSVVSGSILSSEWVRRMWPYLVGIAFVLVGYIAYDFHVQQLHLRRQRLEREVRELGVKAVERTAERVQQTSRSAIVGKLAEKGIPLEEFPHPVKRIER